ncbi:MAG TPA: 6-carboxytetrahydropterin synthase, partial [Pirellulaceae bacterium]
MPLLTSLTREVRVCLGGSPIKGSLPVTNSWVGGPSGPGLSFPLRFRVTVGRAIDPLTGYIEDIAALDRLIRQALRPWGESVAPLARVEAWLPDLFGRLTKSVTDHEAPNLRIERLEVQLSPEWSFAVFQEQPHVVRVTRQYEFSAAHRLHSSQLSEAENRRVFGKCNNVYGHGHNYLLDVSIEGVPQAESQMVLLDGEFDRIVKERAVQRLDHRFLNLELPEFRELNPTVENIAQTI